MSRDPNRDLFAEARDHYTVMDLWRMFFPSAPEPKLGMNRSPLRDEKSPSFSIFEGGRKWKDHGGGCGGDVIEFVKASLDTDYAGVRDWLAERLGIDVEDGREAQRRAYTAPPKPRNPIQWPGKLIEGTEDTHKAFAEKRGLSVAGVETAVRMGILRFLLVEEMKCFAVLDSTGRCAEIRRVGGQLFNGKKAYPLSNVQKDWLPGAVHLVGMPKTVRVLVCEGATDLLTAIDLYSRYAGPERWVCCSLFGATCKSLAPDCATLFKGRYVRICPDGDDAGDKMADEWKRIFLGESCTVDVVRLPRGKDITDLKATITPETLFNVRA